MISWPNLQVNHLNTFNYSNFLIIQVYATKKIWVLLFEMQAFHLIIIHTEPIKKSQNSKVARESWWQSNRQPTTRIRAYATAPER